MVHKMKATATALNLTKTYKNAIDRLEKLLGDNFENAVKTIHNSKSHIVTSRGRQKITPIHQ